MLVTDGLPIPPVPTCRVCVVGKRLHGSEQLLHEHLLRRHPIQYLGQNHLVSRARRDGRTCGCHGGSGGGSGGFGQRASSNLGFLGLPMVGPTIFHE